MSLSKYKFNAGEAFPAENANSIDPENVVVPVAGKLEGGTGHSALAVFQSLATANNGKIKINVDGTVYDDVAVGMKSNLFSTLTYVKNKLLGEPVRFSEDGTKLFCNPTQSYGYYSPLVSTLTTPFDINTATIWKYKDFSSSNYPNYFYLSPDGTMLFWAARTESSGTMYLYKTTLSTPWDITTNGAISNITLYGTGTGFSRLYFSDNGLYIYMPYYTSGTPYIYRFRLTTAWDITTLVSTPDTYLMPTAYNNNSFALTLNSDGTQITFLNESRVAKRYNLPTPYTPSFNNLQSEATIPTGSYGSKYGVIVRGEKFWTSGSNNNFYTEEYAFGSVQSLAEIAENLQTGIRLATSGLETASYDTDKFVIVSGTKGTTSKILKLMTPTNGADISGAGATPYLDCADNATETIGVGDSFALVRLNEDAVLPKEVLDGANGSGLLGLPFDYFLGLGSLLKNYQIFYLPYMTASSYNPTYDSLWTFYSWSSTSCYLRYNYASTSTSGGALYAQIKNNFYNNLSFLSKQVIVEFMVNAEIGDQMGWGLGENYEPFRDYDNATKSSACFTTNTDGKLYAHTSNGSSYTNVEITGITLNSANTYRIEVNPSENVKFYVNGILVATITTTLPISSVMYFGFGTYGNSKQIYVITAPYIMIKK